MSSDRLIRRVLKPLVFAVCLSPMTFFLWELFSDPLVSFNGIVRSTGFWSLRFLCLTLAVTPIRWLTGWHWLVRFRRMMGLFGCFYGVAHTVAYVVFDRVAALDPSIRTAIWVATVQTFSDIGVDLLRPFFTIGLIALALMLPMAATSTSSMIRRLGGRRWQALHRLVYPTAIAAVLHTYWPLTRRTPRYAIIIGLILVVRGIRAYMRNRVSIMQTAAI